MSHAWAMARGKGAKGLCTSQYEALRRYQPAIPVLPPVSTRSISPSSTARELTSTSLRRRNLSHIWGGWVPRGRDADAAGLPAAVGTHVQHAFVGVALRVAARRRLALLVEGTGEENVVLDLAESVLQRGRARGCPFAPDVRERRALPTVAVRTVAAAAAGACVPVDGCHRARVGGQERGNVEGQSCRAVVPSKDRSCRIWQKPVSPKQ